MKTTFEKEVSILSKDGTPVSLMDYNGIEVDESEFPEWLNEIVAAGCVCIVYTAEPALYVKEGYMCESPRMDTPSLLVNHAIWQVLAGYADTFPNATEAEEVAWCESHILQSVHLTFKKDILKVYARIVEK